VRGPSVAKIIAIHTRDDGVPQSQLRQDSSHMLRFVGIGGRGSSGRNVAKLTRTCADAAQDHDGE